MKPRNFFGSVVLGFAIASTAAFGGLWSPPVTAAPSAQPQARQVCWDVTYPVVVPMPGGGSQTIIVHDKGCQWV